MRSPKKYPMKILIPMAGAGSRFEKAGYTTSKPLIPTSHPHTLEKVPMVVAAAQSLPEAQGSQFFFIIRDFHEKSGIKQTLQAFLPQSQFLTLDHLTDGQAATCLLAKDWIDEGPLLIGACDCGIEFDTERFEKARENVDALIITHTRDTNIENNPYAHSWAELNQAQQVTRLSIKTPISETPYLDHATTGLFWFKRGRDFVNAAEKMIAAKDQSGGEYYVDQVMQYLIEQGLRVGIFDVRYLCWGTPQDYEAYENTLEYWKDFLKSEELLSC